MTEAVEVIENSFNISNRSWNQGCLEIIAAKVHADAQLRMTFQRTLRIPDDGKDWPLPPGLGSFPIKRTSDYQVPGKFDEHPGVMFPMFQAEAMWVNFDGVYPFAVKILSGGVNAVTGDPSEGDEVDSSLVGSPDQNYVPTPSQPWLDGFCYEKGKIKQFIAMPLGQGFTVEEQVTGEAKFGGLQIIAYPLKAEIWQAYLDEQHEKWGTRAGAGMVLACSYGGTGMSGMSLGSNVMYSKCATAESLSFESASDSDADAAMGFGGGGSMVQDIYQDERPITDYDLDNGIVVYVHVLNTESWSKVTGEPKLEPVIDADTYSRYHMPWFDYYRETAAVRGSSILAETKSVETLLNEQGKTLGDVSPEVIGVINI